MAHHRRVPPRARDYALLPLRGFLGFTFTFAGLQKLANPAYLDANSPTSVQSTMLSLQHQSPIGWLLSISAHAPVAVGIMIALGELAVGLATIVGLWTRLAAAGGLLLSLTFFLTVSWNTSPYYYGSDIVFLFAWTVPLLRGAWDGPTVDAWISARAARDPDPARRALVLGGAGAAVLAAGAGVLAATTAAVGRALNTSDTTPAAAPPPSPSPSPSPSAKKTHKATQQSPAPTGRLLTSAADLPVGQALPIRDASGRPAWLLHDSAGFHALSAVCTHAGCIVNPQGGELVCPCHGGVYDARTGKVLAGPPPAPLPPVDVTVSGGDVYLT
jgi:thiosulfate dehydrogenase [quinone] large subunit